jgi:K+-sensing histidine kinase KdpD
VLLRVQDVLPDLEEQLGQLRRYCTSALVNALSHESFTPLNKMLTMTDIILTKANTLEQCKKQVALIYEICERMKFMMQS